MINAKYPIRLPAALFFLALFVSGCSGSNDSAPNVAESDSESVTSINDKDNTVVNNAENDNVGNTLPDSAETPTSNTVATSTLIDFRITVPAYKSVALQVQVEWGDKTLNGNWNVDELWTVSDEFPADTENRLLVSFYDRNGAITLGRYEADFRTGMSASQTVAIAADQFNTVQWDDDNDGIANLDELIAGSDPLVGTQPASLPPEPVQVSLDLVQDKTFQFSWQASSTANFYRVLENPDGVSGFTKISDDIDGALLQYDHRVALYRRINASYIVQACNTHSCVDSQTVTVPDSLSPAVGYFKATANNESSRFGSQVALSSDGNTMAVANNGFVYVYNRVNGMWQLQAQLEGSRWTAVADALSLSGNGDVLVVGASRENLRRAEGDEFQPGDTSAGAVYMYKRENGQWTYQARLVSNNISGSHFFGTSVSLSTDGNTLAVGARLARFIIDDEVLSGGAVYLFEQNNESWQQTSYLRADGGEFGTSVSFSHDGTALAVGADRHERSGSAYVFTKSDTGWQQQAFIKADDADTEDEFGASIAIDATGSTLAVGAPFFNFGDPRLTGPIGATYIFKKIDGTWQQETRLNATWQGDAFGRDIALSGDGNTLMIGSQGSSNNGIGLVYVYVRDNETWFEQTKLVGSNAESIDQFGDSLALSNDGETLIVGAPGERSSAQGINGNQNDNSGENTGAVYLF